jgi:hypothetical protein
LLGIATLQGVLAYRGLRRDNLHNLIILLIQEHKAYENLSHCFICVGRKSSLIPRISPRADWLCLITKLSRWMTTCLKVKLFFNSRGFNMPKPMKESALNLYVEVNPHMIMLQEYQQSLA